MIEKKTAGHYAVQAIFVVILVLLALSCLLPLLYNLAVSFSSKEAAEAGLVSFWPIGFTLKAYQEIMGESAFFVSFFVSVKRVAAALLITIPTLTMAAYPLAKSKQEFAPQKYHSVDICILYVVFRRHDSMVYGHEKLWAD